MDPWKAEVFFFLFKKRQFTGIVSGNFGVIISISLD
jgi:hypothetical protein